MKKKVFALILVLALTLAMMAPVLAAVGDTVSPCACSSHVWVDTGNTYRTGYSYYDGIYHTAYYEVPTICSKCATPGTRAVSIPEYHTYNQRTCTACGFVNNSIQSVDGEHTH